MTRSRTALTILAAVALASGAAARDSLGVYGQWGAFEDGARSCYAISQALPSSARRDSQPYVTVSTWPGRGVRGQVHLRLSRDTGDDAAPALRIGDRRFALTGGGNNAWSADRRMDAAILSAMRSAGRMSVSARVRQGRRFSDSYSHDGAATAMEAAAIACARRR